MDWVALGILVLFCSVGLIYAVIKVNSLVAYEKELLNPPKPKLIASLTEKIGIVDPETDKAKEPLWPISCYVYSDGKIEFQGSHSELYFTEKCQDYHRYIIPLSKGVKIHSSDISLAKVRGVHFFN